MNILVGSIIQTKKPHPCGSSEWEVVRVGSDIKIRCLGCGRIVMLSVTDFEKRLKKVVSN
ncbi:MAG: DUF951 domain-containing protein [Clostridia bacterium]|nr:DUF951 domain-containing protein [Clostridia bacterium]